MCDEFIKMSGLEISFKQYAEIVEPMYMATNMSKQDFIEFIAPSVKAMIKRMPKEKTIKKMLVRDRNGRAKTPNGCWYHIEYVEFLGVDISTGKCIIAPLDYDDFEKLRSQGKDLDVSTDYDFDYVDCISKKGKHIELEWAC